MKNRVRSLTCKVDKKSSHVKDKTFVASGAPGFKWKIE